jgi:DNA-binding IscR family transcriptional regulator
LAEFVQTAVKEIDEQLRILKDEAARLQAARAALAGATRRRGRPASNGNARAARRPPGRRNGRAGAATPRRRGNRRADQALELVRGKPGITIPEIATAMNIQPNYLYRVLPQLASDRQVKREGQGWHPTSSSTPAEEPARNVRAGKRTRAAKPKPAASAARPARTRQAVESASVSNGHTARGATKASVLAALSGGGAMTAGQVAAKAGLARPTVSTTLSKLAKTGEVQKAERGYRLAAPA